MIRIFVLGEKGLRVLQNLDRVYFSSIKLVVVGRDANVENDYANEIEKFCNERELQWISRKQLKNQIETKWDLQIAIGWRWLIPDNSNLIVFHDSLLPKYRGFNPLVSALIEGDEVIGVTALYATGEYDRGPIIEQRSVAISYPITIAEAINKLSLLYQEIANIILKKHFSNSITHSAQNENDATFSLWRDEQDYFIDWSESADRLKRKINASGYPYLGARTIIGGDVYIVKECKVLDDVKIINRTPGKIIFKDTSGVVVVCGKGLLRIEEFYSLGGELQSLPANFRLRLGNAHTI